jgi:hypothetical protein
MERRTGVKAGAFVLKKGSSGNAHFTVEAGNG